MGLWNRIFGGRQADGGGDKMRFCFMHTGNRSVIASTYEILRSGLPSLPAGHFRADADRVRERAGSAEMRNHRLQRGSRFWGEKEETVASLADLVEGMAASAMREQHVLLVAARGETYLRLQLVYRATLDQAVAQGILPFPMVVTTDVLAAQLLVNTFETVATSFGGRRLEELA